MKEWKLKSFVDDRKCSSKNILCNFEIVVYPYLSNTASSQQCNNPHFGGLLLPNMMYHLLQQLHLLKSIGNSMDLSILVFPSKKCSSSCVFLFGTVQTYVQTALKSCWKLWMKSNQLEIHQILTLALLA